eukprot:c27355_g1_i1.p1 GENE.c27355_g1_i1~~c27355_g1_i1.p1  ORF type:complete len:470 (+),score=15.44 c27355_g1_i1:46-1455(+)
MPYELGDSKTVSLIDGEILNQVSIPRYTKAIKICMFICFIVYAVTGVLIYFYVTMPDTIRSESRDWKFVGNPQHQRNNWTLTQIRLYSDSTCYLDPIDLTGVKLSGSVIDGNISSLIDGQSTNNFVTLWTPSSLSQPFIQVTFPSSVAVGCAALTPKSPVLTGCTRSFYNCFFYPCSVSDCDSYCCVGSYIYSSVTTISGYYMNDGWSFMNTNSYGDSINLLNYSRSNPDQTNILIAWIVLLCLNTVFCILIPIFYCHIQSQNALIKNLEGDVENEKALAWKCSDQHWQNFMTNEFGSKGRTKTSNIFVEIACILFNGPIFLIILKYKLWIKSYNQNDPLEISWEDGAFYVIPSVTGATILIIILRRLWIKYSHYQLRKRQPSIILGPRSMSFIDFLVWGVTYSVKTTTITRIEGEGLILVVKYQVVTKPNSSEVKKHNSTVNLPIPDRLEETVKQFLFRNPNYHYVDV